MSSVDRAATFNSINFYFKQETYKGITLWTKRTLHEAVRTVGLENIRSPHMALYDSFSKIQIIKANVVSAKNWEIIARISLIAFTVFAVSVATGLLALSLPTLVAVSAALATIALLSIKNSKYDSESARKEIKKIEEKAPNVHTAYELFSKTRAGMARAVHKYQLVLNLLDLCKNKPLRCDLNSLKRQLNTELASLKKNFNVDGAILTTAKEKHLYEAILSKDTFKHEDFANLLYFLKKGLDPDSRDYPVGPKYYLHYEIHKFPAHEIKALEHGSLRPSTKIASFLESVARIAKLQLQLNKTNALLKGNVEEILLSLNQEEERLSAIIIEESQKNQLQDEL